MASIFFIIIANDKPSNKISNEYIYKNHNDRDLHLAVDKEP